jgi:hypothetical protein
MFDNYPIIPLSNDQKKSIIFYQKSIDNCEYKVEEVTCNLCGSDKKRVLFRNDRYGINQITVICMNCGLVYSSPRLTAESTEKFYRSDEYRNIYEGESIEKLFSIRYENVVSYKYSPSNLNKYDRLLFVNFLNETKISFNSICEIGAGDGTNLIPFKKMGREVIGFDYSEKLVSLGRNKGINLFQGSIEDIKKSYELIILIHALEHFLNPVGQLRNLRNYCKKYLFVEIPGIINQVPSLQNAHFYYFSINTLFRCAAKAGFKLIDHRMINSNNYILALFEKNSEFDYKYNVHMEIKNVLRIVNRFKIKNFIKGILEHLPLGIRLIDYIKKVKKKLAVK